MTFDQWIDAVDANVRGRMGSRVRTGEVSWDAAMWQGSAGTVVAALQDDEHTAKLSFDSGESIMLDLGQTRPDDAAAKIVARLGSQ